MGEQFGLIPVGEAATGLADNFGQWTKIPGDYGRGLGEGLDDHLIEHFVGERGHQHSDRPGVDRRQLLCSQMAY